MTPDFEYSTDGLFVSLLPNTPQAEAELSRFMADNGGSNKVFALHWPPVKAALRKAGYSVRKAEPVTISDDALLAALGI